MENSEHNDLRFDEEGVNELKELRKWTYFLSVCGFVFIGLIVVSATLYFISIAMNFDAPEIASLQVSPLILLGAVYFLPVYYLFKFSKYSRQALAGDNSSLSIAFRYLNFHYRYMGVLLILLLFFICLRGSFCFLRENCFNIRHSMERN